MNEEKLKSYWSRRNGKLGTLLAIGALGAIGWKLLPILKVMVWDAVSVTIGGTVLFVLLFALTNRQFRLWCSLIWETFINGLFGPLLRNHPFLLMRDQIKDMIKDSENMFLSLGTLEGNVSQLQLSIGEKEGDLRHTENLMQAARKNNDKEGLTVNTRQYGRIEKMLATLKPMLASNIQAAARVKSIHAASQSAILDAQNELEAQEELYKLVKTTNTAMNSALRFFKGDPEKKLLQRQSQQQLTEQIGKMMGNTRLAMNAANDYVRQIDLENGSFEEAGLRKLQELDNAANFQITKVGEAQPATPAQPSRFSNLLQS